MDVLIWTWWPRALCTEVLITLLHMFVMGLISHCPPQLRGPWAVSNLAGKAHHRVKRVHQSSDIILLGHPLARLKCKKKSPSKKFFFGKLPGTQEVAAHLDWRPVLPCFYLSDPFKQSESGLWLVFAMSLKSKEPIFNVPKGWQR